MNRLQYETSPYLLQHADNPVDWYAWGEEAFATAQAEDKPILLSIGYSACHWCHVMAHESFEDEETAGLMNRLFVNIKVDREERPDVDDIYMQATLMFTGGHGGWPMTVFITPDGRPFHAGTYFPPEPRYGMPSFRQILYAASDAYHNRRGQLEDAANEVTASLKRVGFAVPKEEGGIELDADLLDHAAQKLVAQADPIYGGLHRGQPKFPSPMTLDYLLQYHAHSGDEEVLKVVLFTLRKMAHGGIYDQLGGGFHRYSVDERWLVPHFEKMLYDNAQLTRVYLHAYQVTGDEFFADITRDILNYVEREMLDPSGGFYSTQDADSEGEEGRFFVWSLPEIQEILRETMMPEQLGTVLAYFNVTQRGNFEGHNILNIPHRLEDVAAASGVMDTEELRQAVQQAKSLLFEAREERIKPGRDEKMLAAWNGMMLAAFAEAARVLEDDRYQEIAKGNAQFLLTELSMDDGRLYRTHKRLTDGQGQSKLNGYLEDYASVIDGLIELYQTTFNPHWFEQAERLAEHVLVHFADPDGGFFDTSDDHEALIARPRNMQDNATPAGSNLMAYVLLKLAGYTGKAAYENAAVNVLNQITAAMREYPSAFGTALCGLNLLVRRPIEVAIIGDESAAYELLAVVQKRYHPTVITALATTNQDENATPLLLAHRTRRNDLPTAYVCQNFVCDVPVNTVDALERLLTKIP
ncbi:MAG: thioredoxin domain-containing protein [Chloroflexi bacterium]|nr:thioredoxin domain-containing protein [Chloroflexota bacterium]